MNGKFRLRLCFQAHLPGHRQDADATFNWCLVPFICKHRARTIVGGDDLMKFGFGKSKVPLATEKDFLMLLKLDGSLKMFGGDVSSIGSSIARLLTNDENREVLDRAMIVAFFQAVELASGSEPEKAGPLACGMYLCASQTLKDSKWVCAAQVVWTYYLAATKKPNDALQSAANTQPLLEAMKAPDDWTLVFARAVAMAYDELSDPATAILNWEVACEIKEAGIAEVFSLLDLYFGLGGAYSNGERWEEARVTFLKIWLLASVHAPVSEEAATAAYEIAFASLQAGDPNSGIEFLAKAIAIREELHPSHRDLSEMRNTLAKLKAKHSA